MRDEAPAEERADPAARAIEELIRNDDIERFVLLAQTAHRPGSDNVRAAQLLQREDVGAKGNRRGAEQVAFPLIYPVVITAIVFGLMLFLVTFIGLSDGIKAIETVLQLPPEATPD